MIGAEGYTEEAISAADITFWMIDAPAQGDSLWSQNGPPSNQFEPLIGYASWMMRN
jgi:hypothetical protein